MSAGGAVMMNAEARFGFDFSEAALPSAFSVPSDSSWDTGLWDVALWGGEYAPKVEVFGAVGLGVEAAVAIRLRTSARMTLVCADVGYETGGIL